VYADIIDDLKIYLRDITALHCNYTPANALFDFVKDRKKKYCSHALNYAGVANSKGFTDCGAMPIVSEQFVDYNATPRHWTHIYHMFMTDGHTDNGDHRIENHTISQIKFRLNAWNRHFRGENTISDSTTRESGVGPMHLCFAEQNLYVRWQRMVTDDPLLHKNLVPFEWNLIGLLYRARTQDEIDIAMAAKTSKRSWVRKGLFAEDDTWEEGDFPEVTDPKNLRFEFVAVYASLISLMTGVKAWMTRDITGRVQVCADNMYNPLKGVPNMYWLNVGVMDAKGIHFPTVNALQLGRGHPRNEVLD
jgi:hypothetical protein